MQQNDQIIAVTKKWILDVVIGCNFCPFASKEFKKDSIHYQVTDASDLEKSLQAFIIECSRLDSNAEIETTLLIVPEGFDDFDDFLQLVDFSEKMIHQQGYEGIYQVATFHPAYCFQGSDPNDAANYTNRSPYPILQLLREDTIEKALKLYRNPETIPENNVAFARSKGLAYMRNLLLQVKSVSH